MEETKQANSNSPQSLSVEEATSISGGDGSCATTVTVGTSGGSIQTLSPSPSDGLIAVYEGFVDVTSHIIDRVASAIK